MGFTTLVFCTFCIFGICRCVSTGTSSIRLLFHWFLLECCELGFASHLIDLLLDDRILIFHCVLDDLGMFHHHCVDVVLVMHAHDGSQLDPALRYTSFDWSLRVRDLLRDFRNSDDLICFC